MLQICPSEARSPSSDETLRRKVTFLTNKMTCVLMVNGQILNSTGYVCYVGSVSRIHKPASAQITNLEFVPEFFLDPGRQAWLRATISQEQIVLKIYDL